jgi:hypothetical protein
MISRFKPQASLSAGRCARLNIEVDLGILQPISRLIFESIHFAYTCLLVESRLIGDVFKLKWFQFYDYSAMRLPVRCPFFASYCRVMPWCSGTAVQFL